MLPNVTSYDVITIGSATVDFFMKSTEFHLQPSVEGILLCQKFGSKLDIDDFAVRSGGAGTNTAVGFQRLGFQTAAVVEIGKDFLGQVVWDDLRREHVSTELVVTEKSEQTAMSVLLIAAEGGRSALTHRGASGMLEARDLPWDHLARARWIHLSNVSGNFELLTQLFQLVKQNLMGLSWNPGRKELELLARGSLSLHSIAVDILFVNDEEWELLLPVQAHVLTAIPQVVVTRGKTGGTVYLKGQYLLDFSAPTIHAVQETGAGDAFAVGYVAAHLLGEPVTSCCSWGVRNSVSVIQQMDAKKGLLTRREIYV